MGTARVYGADRANVPEMVPLMADMLHIDPETQLCTLVWRGSFPISSEAALASIAIAGGLSQPGEPAVWPKSESELFDVRLAAARSAAPPPPSVDRTEDLSGTMVMPPAGSLITPKPKFDGTMLVDAPASSGRALPFSESGSAKDEGARRSQQARGAAALPFQQAPRPPIEVPIQAPARRADNPLAGTASLSEADIAAAVVTPFELANPGVRDAPPSPIPGAPWTKAKGKTPPLPTDLKGTMPTALNVDDFERVERQALAENDRQAREAEERLAREAAEQQARAAAEITAAEQEAEQHLLEAQQAEAEAKAAAEKAQEQAAEAEKAAQQRAAEQLAAQERRADEAERFAREQQEAQQEQERRAEEQAKRKQEAAKQLESDMYGGFKRKR